MLQSSLARRATGNSNSISLRHGEVMVRFAFVALGIAAAIAAVAALADLAGFPAAGGAIGGAVGGVIAAMMFAGTGRKACPRCAAELPLYRKPASLKQALWGG
jgi:membrane associated rhomboid family serine protease